MRVDLLNKIGFKNGIIYGLVISAAGALLMIPAVNSGSFVFILTSFFVIAIGFSLQQTAANPFAVALGTPETGADRLNLAGGVNNFGSILGPIIVSLVLFGSASSASPKVVEIGAINNLYYILAGLFIGVAIFFATSKLPKVTSDEHIEAGPKTNIPLLVMFVAFLLILLSDFLAALTHTPKPVFVYAALVIIVLTLVITSLSAQKSPDGWGAMKYPQLILGMLAIFTYVGVEVSIQSNMGALLKLPEFGGYNEATISPFISLYWGSLMIGRWTGAVSAFKLSKTAKRILTIVVPFVSFGVILFFNHVTGTDISQMYIYAVCVLILIAAFFYSQEKPAKTLAVFSTLGILAMIIGLSTTGKIAAYVALLCGLVYSL